MKKEKKIITYKIKILVQEKINIYLLIFITATKNTSECEQVRTHERQKSILYRYIKFVKIIFDYFDLVSNSIYVLP